MKPTVTKLEQQSVEAEILRAVDTAAGNSFSMRVERLGSRVTLVVGWIKGLEYKHAEVVVADGKDIEPNALVKALREIE